MIQKLLYIFCFNLIALATHAVCPVISVSNVNHVGCFGGNNGAITVNVSNSTNYTLNWSNGLGSSLSVSGLSIGVYFCNVTDNTTGCTDVEAIAITQPNQIVIGGAVTNVSCNNQSTGSINTTVSGGTTPYTFAWTNGASAQVLVGLSAATYSVTVTDQNNCTQTQQFIVSEPAQSINLSLSAQNPTCNATATGSLDATVFGGTTPYTYQWTTSAQTQDVTNLSAGSYTVTVTDANGCSQQASSTLVAPAALMVTENVQNSNCAGQANGSINLNPSGGTSPYTYNWQSSSSVLVGNQTLSSLQADQYSYTVTDANGCNRSGSSTISEPPTLGLNLNGSGAACFGSNNGYIILTATGGTPGYLYNWDDTSGVVSSTSKDLNSIVAGRYRVTVTDNNGCVISDSIDISQPTDSVSALLTVDNIACFGQTTGGISVAPAGGTPPYSYLWNTGATAQNLTALSAGSYAVQITDANGCILSVPASITQPQGPVLVIANLTQVDCAGGSNGGVDLTVSGGTAPYTYAWQSSSFQLAGNQDILQVGADQYAVTVSDANGCIDTSSYTISEPAPLIVNATVTPVSCNGGSDGVVDLSVSGGTPAYSYAWENSAGPLTSTFQDLINQPAEVYSTTVTDANGCEQTSTLALTEPVSPVVTTTNIVDVDCFGESTGEINHQIAGGTPPYAYQWSNGNTAVNLIQVPAGSYDLTITDANSCTYSFTDTISEPQNALSVTSITQDVDCFGNATGQIDLSTTGGTLPYNYQWFSSSFQLTSQEDQFNLEADQYAVTVTDANGCEDTLQLVINEPNALSITSTITPILCFGDSTGAVDATTIGGTLPYSFSWNRNGILYPFSSEDLNSLPLGTYALNVVDANGCTASLSQVVSQPLAPLTMQLDSTAVECFGDNSGSVSASAQGGTAPYHYVWNTGDTLQVVTQLFAGNYAVTTTDQNGCFVNGTTTITQPDSGLSVAVIAQNIPCNGDTTGSISLSPSGGTQPYNYNWTSNAFTFAPLQNQQQLAAGTYFYTVTDALGCTFAQATALSEPPAITSTFTSSPVLCFGGSDGTIDLSVTGGVMPYTFAWTNSGGAFTATSEDLSALTADTFNVLITDANGCTSSRSIQITEPASPLSASLSSTNISCFSDSTGAIVVQATGGTGAYTYTWNSPLASGFNPSQLPAGSYTITLTDVNNCDTSYTVSITEPAAPLFVTHALTNLNCFADSSGAIDITVSGGTSPYNYGWQSSFFTLANVEDLQNLQADTFLLTVTDTLGCIWNDTFSLTQPQALTLNATITDVLCHSFSTGSISSTVQGGTQPYQYNWNTSSTNPLLNNLTAGSYTLTVTDANGCTIADSYVVDEPASLPGAMHTISDATCFNKADGEIELFPFGGTVPYTYNWNNGDTGFFVYGLLAANYQVTLTDANGCTYTDSFLVNQPAPIDFIEIIDSVSCNGGGDGSIQLSINGGTAPFEYTWGDSVFLLNQSSLALLNQTAGMYTVTVEDANNCIHSEQFTIPQPQPWTVDVQVIESPCPGTNSGSIDITVGGNNPGYAFTWSNGASTEDIFNLAGGTYIVTIEDRKGCDTIASGFVFEPEPIVIDAEVTPISCRDAEDGQIQLTFTGGTGTFSFDWSNGAMGNPVQDLAAGSYIVTATDASNCSLSREFEVETSPVACIDLTNTFTPNGDGLNDTWFIQNIEIYPNMTLFVYNKVGQLVYEASGEYEPWDGTNGGNELPSGTYYYVLNLNRNSETYSGTITIVR